MKKNKLILVIGIAVVLCFVTGCKSETEKEMSTSKVLTCSRTGDVTNGEATLSYKIYYKDDNINILHSTEKVTSSEKSILDEFEEAYKKIFSNYKDLEYYDNTVTRNDNSVTNDTVINYKKIDTDKLLSIEGKEDNIIVDGKAKLSKWQKLAKKFGATCEEE